MRRSIRCAFKSDRCGIETTKAVCESAGLEGSNQTVAGLKRVSTQLSVQIHPRSNQTVAGLKHGQGNAKYPIRRRSNQTVAGLKRRRNGDLMCPRSEFKSDRCGIETWRRAQDMRQRQSSNQTVAGLKLRYDSRDLVHVHGSNQTVAGSFPSAHHTVQKPKNPCSITHAYLNTHRRKIRGGDYNHKRVAPDRKLRIFTDASKTIPYPPSSSQKSSRS